MLPENARAPAVAPAVLVADNDRAVSGLLTEVLTRSGLRVVHAFDGVAAAAMARDAAVRVLVCDLDMPGASGLDVLASLADLPSPPQVIVVSGYLDGDVRQRLARLPFVREVLGKPFDLLAFAASVRALHAAGGERAAPACHDGAAPC